MDASFDAWSESAPGLGTKFGELAQSFTGLVFLPAKVLKILKDQFSPESRFGRVLYLLEGLRIGLKRLESETEKKFADAGDQGAKLREQMTSLQSRIETPQFEEAVAIACEESTRATNLEKAGQFASILVGSLTPEPWYGPAEDIGRMIRDLAQLGEIDILILRELETTFEGAGGPNLNGVNDYTGRMPQLRQAITRSKLHPDDFYAVCSRLAGFGLALQEERNNSRMDLPERCFRPTHRGKTLLFYLRAGGTASRQKECAAG